jgi:hypothetical protein
MDPSIYLFVIYQLAAPQVKFSVASVLPLPL